MRDARWEQRQMSRESWLKTNPEMSLASLEVQASGNTTTCNTMYAPGGSTSDWLRSAPPGQRQRNFSLQRRAAPWHRGCNQTKDSLHCTTVVPATRSCGTLIAPAPYRAARSNRRLPLGFRDYFFDGERLERFQADIVGWPFFARLRRIQT